MASEHLQALDEQYQSSHFTSGGDEHLQYAHRTTLVQEDVDVTPAQWSPTLSTAFSLAGAVRDRLLRRPSLPPLPARPAPLQMEEADLEATSDHDMRSRADMVLSRPGRSSGESSSAMENFAHQDLALLQMASLREATPDPDPVARQLHILTLAHALRSLPPDLSVAEKAALQSCLPPTLTDGSQATTWEYASRSRRGSRSAVRRATAGLVARTVLIVAILWPYVKALLLWMQRLERQHHMTERAGAIVFGLSMLLTDSVQEGVSQGWRAVEGLSPGRSRKPEFKVRKSYW